MKKYFPGANSGKGFFSRFDGIVPPWESPHYTYVLKGGPGVGKNTLMRTVAERALKKGYEVEEFRCASDPKGLDAVRIAELHTVLLDGTAPHTIDPVIPGVCDEIINLGHFKNISEFKTFLTELEKLFAENKKCYRAAYSMLGAANMLKSEAINALSQNLDMNKVSSLAEPFIKNGAIGKKRALFATSATPEGVIDYSDTFLPSDTTFLHGIEGEAILCKIYEMLNDYALEVLFDFAIPENPRAIVLGDFAIAVNEGNELHEDIDEHIAFNLQMSEQLVSRATKELKKALSIHDEIEAIYRGYVDYDRVNEEREKLLKRLGL